MICALIKDGVVTDTRDLDEAGVHALCASYDSVIDIEGYDPMPTVGWILQGNKLVLGPGMSAVPNSIITKLALRERFTLSELTAIYTAKTNNATLQVLMDNLTVATFIDLARPDTVGGIQALVSFGLLTQPRATAILTAPVLPIEIYKG